MSRVQHNQFSVPAAALKVAGGILAGTRVLTMDGALPVEFLTPGDRILTRSGVAKLATMSVRVDQDTDMVRVGPATLGHDRPEVAVFVPVHQMILVRDWRAQVLYGAPHALVAAGRLADGAMIRMEKVFEARLFTLVFDHDVVIYAGGLELACLREAVTA